MENPSARHHYMVAGVDLGTDEARAKGLSHIAKEFLTFGKLSAPDPTSLALE
jgi:hypothetical protein